MRKYLLPILFMSLFYWGCEEEQPEEVDTTPPTVTISYPLTNSTVSEMVTINCISSDNEGVEKVELWVNGVTTELTDDSEPYSFDWNTTLVDNGSYSITVRSFDTNDNTTDSEPIVLTVDNTQSNPQPINITSVVFENGGFTITWNQSTDGDFGTYELEKSIDSTMNNLSVVFTTDSLEQTTYFDTDVDPFIYQYYQVTVIDTFDYETKGEIYSSSLESANPVGIMNWEISEVNGVGQLPENLQGTNTTLGIIDADDPNPDDEIESVTIKSQKVNGNNHTFFTIEQDFIGDWKLVLIPSANIDYETLHLQNGSSTQSVIVMEITDDSPSHSKDTLTVSVLITNVNEPPTWGNTSIGTTADEGILFQSPEITWSDVDLGDSHTLSSDNLPGWLTLDVNKLTGTPSTADVNPSTSFTLNLQDQGGLEITKSFTINVRGNEAPSFTGASAQTWEEERSTSWTISWSDPNSVDYSTMEASVSDLVSDLTFTPNQNGTNGTVSGYLPTSYVNQDINFSITLDDKRAGNPLTATESFTITIDPNDAPNFSNTTSIPQSLNHGCQYYYDVNWSDPDGDNVVLTYDNDVDWLNINSNGILSGTPTDNDIGSSGTVLLTITDNRPNVPLSTDYSFSINVDENFAPEFLNSGSVDTTATVGEEYSFQFAINDANSDALTFTVPTKPSWLMYNASLYKIYGTPNSNHVGTNNVTVKVEDCGTSTSFSFSIVVN